MRSMLVPINGFVQGDTLGLLLLVQHHHTVRELAECALQAASARVGRRGEVDVWFDGLRLDPDVTLSSVGLGALDRVDVVFRDTPWK